tara:strand:- start:731 stop:1147 length:417 start_codon:yes stop_codon:yes gene_type:complete
MKIKMEIIIIIIIIIGYLLYNEFTRREHTVYGKIAWSRKEAKQGLMFRKHPLHYNEGMLFPMKKNNINSMWMKNTYIPLDIIFLNDSMEIVGYIQDAEPLSTKSLKINKPSSYVLEMNGNSVVKHNIKIGDKIIFVKK